MESKTTSQVIMLRQRYTDEELCKKIGIGKPTFYRRLGLHNWKVAEVFIIDKMK